MFPTTRSKQKQTTTKKLDTTLVSNEEETVIYTKLDS